MFAIPFPAIKRLSYRHARKNTRRSMIPVTECPDYIGVNDEPANNIGPTHDCRMGTLPVVGPTAVLRWMRHGFDISPRSGVPDLATFYGRGDHPTSARVGNVKLDFSG